LPCPLRFPHENDVWLALPPVFCRRAHVLFTLFVLFANSGVQHMLSWGFCFVCLCLVSCVPNVASFYGLSILICPFGFLWRLFTQYYFGIYHKNLLTLISPSKKTNNFPIINQPIACAKTKLDFYRFGPKISS